jgi:phospholipid N-methyltransferase
MAASIVPSSPILVTLMKEALSSSKTSVLTGPTRHNIPEATILHSHRHENLKSYMVGMFAFLPPLHNCKDQNNTNLHFISLSLFLNINVSLVSRSQEFA